MNFSRLLARLAAQILLGIASFIWLMIAFLDPNRGDERWLIGAGAVLSVAALLRLGKGGRWVSWAGAFGMILPIGALTHANGASPWLWVVWILVALGTERWIREGHSLQDRG